MNGLRVIMGILTVVALVGLAGCATADHEQTMPWNSPQSWEGTPGIPGFSRPEFGN